MKVKIMSCNSPLREYDHRIGEILDVLDYGGKFYYEVKCSPDEITNNVLKTDCTVVEGNIVKPHDAQFTVVTESINTRPQQGLAITTIELNQYQVAFLKMLVDDSNPFGASKLCKDEILEMLK